MIKELLKQKGLSFDRLATLEKVAKHKNVTAAAGADPTTQSLYSRQIKELESYFGTKLIERNKGGISLTPNGANLYSRISEISKLLSDFKEHCQNAPKQFVIHSGNTFFDWYLLPNLSLLHKQHKDWNYTLSPLARIDIFKNVESMRCDLGIMRDRELPSNLKKIKLGTYRYAIYLPKGAKHSNDLSRYRFALHEQGSFRRFVNMINERDSLGIKVALECRSFSQAKAALQTGYYATMLPYSSGENPELGKAYRPSWIRELDSNLVAVWNKRMEEIKPEVVELAQSIQAIMKEAL